MGWCPKGGIGATMTDVKGRLKGWEEAREPVVTFNEKRGWPALHCAARVSILDLTD